MSLTIVIPALNEAAYLPNILSDLIAQDHQSFSCIVVDGGSTDGTHGLVEEIASKDTRFSLIRSSIANVSLQRNLGVHRAPISTEYILFLDADTRIAPTFLTQLWSRREKSWVALTLEALPDTKNLSDRVFLEVQNLLYRFFALVGRPYCWGACLLVRRDVFIRLGGFDETITHMEDSELVQRLIRDTGSRFVVLHHPQFVFSMRRYRGRSKLAHSLSLIPTFFRSLVKQEFRTPEELYPMLDPAHRGGRRKQTTPTER